MGNMKYIGKCVYVEEEGKKIVVIGDLHIGYEQALNDSGVFVSRTAFDEMIRDMDEVFDSVNVGGKVDEIVLLGDVKHEFGSILRQEWKDMGSLFDYLLGKVIQGGKVVVTKGNHDALVSFMGKKKGVEIVDYYVVGEYCFMHGDRNFKEVFDDKKIKTFVIGHVHPAVKISDGVKIEKFKCFLEGKLSLSKKLIVVPSFSEYSVGSDPRDGGIKLAFDVNFDKFEVFVVGEKLEVLDFGKLGKIN